MRQSSPKRTGRTWTILALIAVVIAAGVGLYHYATTQPNKTSKAVETSTINTGDIILSATGLGKLIPRQEVSFGFKAGGHVSEVLVGLGDTVQAGQVLARLENSTLELKYRQAAGSVAALSSPAEIAKAAQALQDARLSFATARDDLGYLIGPDMLVAEESVADAQQQLQMVRAALEQDATDANRQSVTQAEVDLKKAEDDFTYAYYNHSNTYTLQTFTYPVRNSKGTTIRRQLFAPTNSEIDAARAAYQIAAANLSDAQNYLDVLNGVQQAEAVPSSSVTSITEAKVALDSAKANLVVATLIAPISGTITSINLNAGENVGTSAVITISDMDQPYVIDTALDETDWDKARVGYAATVTFDLLPDDEYPGTIIQVYPKLDDSSGTSMVRVLVQLDQSTRVDLPSGATGGVDIVGGEALGAVLVPASALQEIEPGKYVVYLMNDGQPVQQPVEIGLQDILNAEVKSGLKKGDVVLTDASNVTP